MSTGDCVWEGGVELGGDVGVGCRALSDSRNQALSVQGISSKAQGVYMGLGSCQTTELFWLGEQQVQGLLFLGNLMKVQVVLTSSGR